MAGHVARNSPGPTRWPWPIQDTCWAGLREGRSGTAVSSGHTQLCLARWVFRGGPDSETSAATKHVTLSVCLHTCGGVAMRAAPSPLSPKRPCQGENPGAWDTPCVTASRVCSLQGCLWGGIEGLRLPALPADGGRRLGGGLRVLRAAALHAERPVPDPQHVLGPDGAAGRQVGQAKEGHWMWWLGRVWVAERRVQGCSPGSRAGI